MATTRNPLDMNNLRHFPDALRAVLDDACYGAILCSVGQMGFISKSMNELHAAIARMREDHPDKYIAVVANCSPETRDKFQSLDCFVSDDQNKAISAMAAARYIAGSFEKRAPVIASAELTSLKIDGQNLAGELAAKRMIAGAGIPITQDYLACSAEDAIAFARKIGRRIVLKIASPDIAHKSDLGCVRVGIEPDDDVGRIYSELMDHAKLIVPKARLQGVIVSPMIHDGIEVILGAKRDPVFGAVVMFGLGGIFVEILRDKALRIAPFGPEEALQMITETKAYEILKGARGGPKRDIPALAEALSRLSLFAHANTDTIASVEINPLMVLVGGGGVIAVDALIL